MTFQERFQDINQRFVGCTAWPLLEGFAQELGATLNHGDMETWSAAIDALVAEDGDARTNLMQIHPWRKGPLDLFGCRVETEWRSDWKWQRLMSSGLDFSGKQVLDVGCGNGFYMYEMLKSGAAAVVGVDPTQLFVAQFMALYADNPQDKLAFVPTGLEKCPPTDDCFDVVLSMGVLYHRKDQNEHLNDLISRTKAGGKVVLETLVLDDANVNEGEEELTPHLVGNKRYAQMRNVWSVPSLSLLIKRMTDCGYKNISVVDCSYTSLEEQRSTEWMHFQSLPDFLDPNDRSKTLEGYQAPMRALLIADKV
ncbi:MAG: tRNA 5-methoxyuridine(34)/uridine 5-oxyacetic acid(34) synthase CmoB [Alphaproteobacteria bacterium]